jgi:uncharacterized protein YbaA (DUF1428 family)
MQAFQGDFPMHYVDGFVTPVPTDKKAEYLEHAVKFAELFKKHGALKVAENWGDDVPEGKLTSFTMAVKREDTESVVFSWITWPSREVRDAGWKTIMEEPAMQSGATPPFDGKRMIYGGFQTILEV